MKEAADEGGSRRWWPDLPADRADRQNLRYRWHLAHPWISALLFWLVLMVIVVLPICWAIIAAGGIPPDRRYASDSQYFGWTGSPANGHSSALVVGLTLAVVLAGCSLWVGTRTRDERDEVRRLDAKRIASGVPRLAHDTEPPLEHRWFGFARRRILRQVPAPRATNHHDHPPGPRS